ncbi:MAG: MoaD/ThiS family protein [Elusimicrobiales bacterium]
MAKVIVKLYTTLKDRLGESSVILEGGSASDVIGALAAAKPGLDRLLLDEEGVLRAHFAVTLNSDLLDHRKMAQAKLKDGDVLHVFPPVSGG